MANVSKPNIKAEMSFEELAVIKRALQGACDNWYFDTDRERDIAFDLLRDLGA